MITYSPKKIECDPFSWKNSYKEKSALNYNKIGNMVHNGTNERANDWKSYTTVVKNPASHTLKLTVLLTNILEKEEYKIHLPRREND